MLVPPAAIADSETPPRREEVRAAVLPGIEQLYRDHYAFVWRITGRLGVPAAAVEDAVQDVFVVLHRRRHEFDDRGSIRALLYGITRRVARRYRARPRVALADPPPDTSERTGPEEVLARRQAAAVLRTALDAMDEDKRMAFVLADLEEMSVPEVARCLDINLNTAYSRLRAARRLIRRAIARHRAKDSRL